MDGRGIRAWTAEALLMLQKVIVTPQAWNALWNQYFALPDRYSELQLLFATSVRRQVGVILQDPCPFSGSIADNIGLNDAEALPAAIRKAAENAHLAPPITVLPQRLRRASPRACGGTLDGPEAVSRFRPGAGPRAALPRAGRGDLERGFGDRGGYPSHARPAGGGRTSIVIAHRLSTIRQADRIVVLHKGRATEIGAHKELLAKGCLYAQLHQLQTLIESESLG